MGVVYRAWDPVLACVVAIKLVSEESIPNESARLQLYTEARIASSLNHANICKIKDVIEESGQAGIVMEFVEGRVLTNAIGANVGLPFDLVVEYGIQIADAVCHAHEHDVIHRDLKSGNVMVTRENQIKLLDFGLSKVQRRSEIPALLQNANTKDSSDSIAGTPPYWAPEVLKHYPSDTRSDLWSLGILLYEMASGQMPFRGATMIELGSAILHGVASPLPERVPESLSKIVFRCLRKEMTQRYQHANEIRAALQAIDPSGSPGSGRQIVVSRFHAPVIRSVAVLPLENLSGAPDQDYFADGLTESLITALAKIGSLRVISRTSIMQYKHAPKTLPQIARELSVDAVVEGSVLRDGDRVRITAELIEARTDQHLWTESYDRDLRNILTLQSQVANAIAAEIRAKLRLPGEQLVEKPDFYSPHVNVDPSLLKTAGASSINPKAYDLYLRGRYFWNNQVSENGLRQVVEYYRRAIEIDPQSALTYSGLAHCFFLMGAGEYGFRAPSDAMQRAKEAALKALSFDDSIAEAHLSLAMVKFRFEWDWNLAEKHLRRAIELNHGYYLAHYLYTIYLLALERFDEAFTEAKIAQQLSPLSPDVHFSVGLLLYASGQNEEAIEHLKATVAMDANFPLPHIVLGLAFAKKDRFDDSIFEFKQALAITGERPLWLGYLGQVYALAGRTSDAMDILQKLQSGRTCGYVPPLSLAFVYAGLNKINDAFHWMGKAVDERDGLLIYLRVGSAFDSLRSDPRFSVILAQVGLQEDPALSVAHPTPKSSEPNSDHKPVQTSSSFLAVLFVGVIGAALVGLVGLLVRERLWPTKTILALQTFKVLRGDADDPDLQR